MSNKAPKRPKPKKKPQKATKKTPKKSPIGIVFRLVAPIGGIIGAIATLLTFWPRMSANVSDPVDPNNIFSSAVSIENTGFIPLDNVKISVAPDEITGEDKAPEIGFGDDSPSIGFAGWTPRDIGIDERLTLPLDQMFGNFNGARIKHAEIEIVIDYEIPIIHIQRRKRFPFYVRQQADGKFAWYSDSIHSQNPN